MINDEPEIITIMRARDSRKRKIWALKSWRRDHNNDLPGFYSHASPAWTWRVMVNKNICAEDGSAARSVFSCVKFELNSICRSCWCLRKITSLKSKKGIRKMLIRHAILEMFKYLEPDWNHTPARIEITRLLIANSCCSFSANCTKNSRILFYLYEG